MTNKLSLLIITLILLFGCETQRQHFDPEATKKAITAVLDQQVVDWNHGDITAFMQGYWQSDSLLFVSSTVAKGWQNVLDRYRRGYDSPEKMGKLAFTIYAIDLLGEDHAKVYGKWQLQRANDAPGGYFTLILARRAEGWRIIHDHTSVSTN